MGYLDVNRLRFDFLTCILVLFDVFILPLENSIGLDFVGDSTVLLLNQVHSIFDIIFFVDLVLGFRRAYINEKTGLQVICPKLIAIRYLKFYFWIDLLGCIPFG